MLLRVCAYHRVKRTCMRCKLLRARRYKQTVDCVLAFRDSKHTNVKQQVMLLIPKMSEFAPEKFVLSYLEPCTAHLLSVLANKSHANSIAFQAFGQMIAPLAGPTSCRELARRLQCRLPDIEKEVLDALAVKSSREQAKRSTCVEAVTCVGVMAEVWRNPRFHMACDSVRIAPLTPTAPGWTACACSCRASLQRWTQRYRTQCSSVV